MTPGPGRSRSIAPDELVRDTLFESRLVAVGVFRAGPARADFREAVEIDRHLLAFPRNAVRITPEGHAPFLADPGTVAYYNAGQVVTRELVDPAGDACDLFAVRPDVLAEIVTARDPSAPDRPDRPFDFTHGPSGAAAYLLQRQLLRYLRRNEAPDALAVEEATLRLVGALLGHAYDVRGASAAGADRRRTAGAELADAVRRHVVATYRESASLAQLAEHVGRSPFHTCRMFRRHTGTSIHAFRQDLRLRRSLELAAETASDLSRVALHLGFSSHSHFTSAFKRAFGLTPSAFRRNPSSRLIEELADRVDRCARF